MRRSIPAEERLALTLRWLATGWYGLLTGKGSNPAQRLFLTILPPVIQQQGCNSEAGQRISIY